MLFARPEVIRYALGLMAAVLGCLLLVAGMLALIAWVWAAGAPDIAAPLGAGLTAAGASLVWIGRRAMARAG